MDDKNSAKPEKPAAIINLEKKAETRHPGKKATPEKKFEINNAKEKVLAEINRSQSGEVPASPNISLFAGTLADASNLQKAGQTRQKEVEKIMEENIEKIFLSLSPKKQAEFKIAGERTAAEINGLLEKGKATMKKVIDLIKKWLLIIPGVNRFFLEQEAKIKADKILGVK
ncbi:MAG: hypothetical protein WCW25_00590 [Patescibacteria group bacterium]|jgi:hypothetical protein